MTPREAYDAQRLYQAALTKAARHEQRDLDLALRQARRLP